VGLEDACPSADRRGDLRHIVSLDVTCEPMVQKTRRPLEAKVVDLSARGLCLETACAFESDAILQVHFLDLAEGMDLSLLVRVRWVKAAKKGWTLGCAFVHALPKKQFEAIFMAGKPKTVLIFHLKPDPTIHPAPLS
jgi:hypothetical protein